jgi:hypothetical protein
MSQTKRKIMHGWIKELSSKSIVVCPDTPRDIGDAGSGLIARKRRRIGVALS